MKILLIAIIGIVIASFFLSKQAPIQNSEKTEIPSNAKEAYFAGGCFWCMEAAYEELSGVVEVISGYMGGTVPNPTYHQVSSGTTGHLEAVKVIYDPKKVSYKELVDFFWRNADPTDEGGQFADRGTQYTTAIFYKTEEEKSQAEKSKEENQKRFESPIVTPILPLTEFYEAEEEHQDYYKKRVLQYKLYEKGSGRAAYKESQKA
ncbi:MAG: peptide-methionine (S)-S-oxide reductase MsrA [Nanoarchaeota archaeon]|nr:peptide-methionine (S)-S-oxide reductase MsrA [Nanoarchaeota archaeon]